MPDVKLALEKSANILIKLLPLLSFVLPIILLYSLYPGSFEGATPPLWEGWWQGRYFYFFFLWLAFLEIILGWEKLQTSKVNKLKSIRTVMFVVTLLLPTIYIIVANYYGLNAMIADLAKHNIIATDLPSVFRDQYAVLVPLAVEYLVFAMLFGLMTFLKYGIKGIKDFSISTFFLVIIGVLYMIDDVYPYLRFTPFRIFVSSTASLAANVLNLMGYGTTMSFTDYAYIRNVGYVYVGYSPVLQITDSLGRKSSFIIAWPCAGVESLLIYTLTTLLFLKNATFLWKHRKIYFAIVATVIYFAIGAIVTYFINALRIASIFVISINGGDWSRFHNIYGPLYSIVWIVAYPLIILGSRALWEKTRNRKTGTKDNISHSKSIRNKG
jgi:exosortase/archaeosortase family protein